MWPYGDFSDIKSSIRNTADGLKFFIAIFLSSENAATAGGRLADLKKSVTLNSQPVTYIL